MAFYRCLLVIVTVITLAESVPTPDSTTLSLGMLLRKTVEKRRQGILLYVILSMRKIILFTLFTAKLMLIPNHCKWQYLYTRVINGDKVFYCYTAMRKIIPFTLFTAKLVLIFYHCKWQSLYTVLYRLSVNVIVSEISTLPPLKPVHFGLPQNTDSVASGTVILWLTYQFYHVNRYVTLFLVAWILYLRCDLACHLCSWLLLLVFFLF